MSLLHLPPELLRQVLVHAVTVRGLRMSLRLRLINRKATTLCTHFHDYDSFTDRLTGLFAVEVTHALHQSDVLDDHVKEKSLSSEDRQNPEHENFGNYT
jgi:hypothetical protein